MDDATPERWLPVVGYEGLYWVSDQGRIRSRYRIRKLHVRSQDGYVDVSLSAESRVRARKVHQLVAAAFIGPRPEGMHVRHLDGDKLNNSAANLAYGTALDNAHDKVIHGVVPKRTRKLLTHCKRANHEMTPENTYVEPGNGSRKCRACLRARMNARNAAARAA